MSHIKKSAYTSIIRQSDFQISIAKAYYFHTFVISLYRLDLERRGVLVGLAAPDIQLGCILKYVGFNI